MASKLVKKDHLAGMALIGLLNNRASQDQWEIDAIAALAYRYADAMCRASNAKNDNEELEDSGDSVVPADDEDADYYKMRKRGKHF